jgi:hypothetical protein
MACNRTALLYYNDVNVPLNSGALTVECVEFVAIYLNKNY